MRHERVRHIHHRIGKTESVRRYPICSLCGDCLRPKRARAWVGLTCLNITGCERSMRPSRVFDA